MLKIIFGNYYKIQSAFIRNEKGKKKNLKVKKKSDENENSEKILQPKMNFFLLFFYFRSHTFSMTKENEKQEPNLRDPAS